MRTRKRITLVAVSAVLAAVACYILTQSWRSAREQKARQAVYYWVRSTAWWNHDLTEAENFSRQLDELRRMESQAVAVLRRDLVHDPARFKLLRKLPFLKKLPFVNGLLPQPDDVDGPQEVRHRAAYFLGMLGPAASEAVPELLSRSADPDSRVRFEAAFSLGRIGVDSREVRAALTRMLGDGDKAVEFSAAISLWLLEPNAEKSVSRVQSLISSNYLSWPSLCLQKIGPPGRVFVPVVELAIANMPWSHARIQAVHALWLMTGDRQKVLREIESLPQGIPDPATINTTTGWTSVEETIGYVGHQLEDEKVFRDAIRPFLKRILANPNSQARRMATVYLERFDLLDRREAGIEPPKPSASPPAGP